MRKITLLVLLVVLLGGCSLNKKEAVDNVKEPNLVDAMDTNTSSTVNVATSSDYELPDDQSVMSDVKRPEKFRSQDAAMIKKIIPSGVFLRDFVSLPNKYFLVAYIIEPKLGLMDGVLMQTGDDNKWVCDSCSDCDFGQTIQGKYKLALIRNGKIVNEIDIPFPDYDKWPDYTVDKPDENGAIGYSDLNDVKGVWKTEGSLTFRQSRCSQEPDYYLTEDWKCKYPGNDFIEIPLLVMEDLTGDKLPYETRIMTEYISCGNDYYVIAGFDPAKNKAVIYPIIDEEAGIHVSYSNLNPDADGSFVFDSGCDHGSEAHSLTYYKFNKSRKAYVFQKSTETKGCEDVWSAPRTYSDLIKLNDKAIKPYIGRKIKWKGRVAKYVQKEGIKFCIVDDQYPKPNIHGDCEWFWAKPRELATKDDPSLKKGWNGDWPGFMFRNYSTVEYGKVDVDKDIFVITGKIKNIDRGIDALNRPIPNIEVIKIEKLQ